VTLINDVDSSEFKHKDYGEKLIDTGAGYLIKDTDRKPKPRKIHREIVQEEGRKSFTVHTFYKNY